MKRVVGSLRHEATRRSRSLRVATTRSLGEIVEQFRQCWRSASPIKERDMHSVEFCGMDSPYVRLMRQLARVF